MQGILLSDVTNTQFLFIYFVHNKFLQSQAFVSFL